MKPHPSFETIRADEVAETWDGVPEALYVTLWNDIVPDQKPIPNREDTGPADHVGFESLASHWDKLSEADQLLLNNLAEARDKEFDDWFRAIAGGER